MLEKNIAQSEKTIWIDVTTSFRWMNTAVGIVRTELEIAKYLIEKKSVKLCVWNKDTCHEISISQYKDKMNQLIARGAHRPVQGKMSVKTVLVSVAKRIFVGPLRRLVPPLKLFANAFRSLLVEVKFLISRVPGKLKYKLGLQSSSEQDVSLPFKKDDIYITMGLDWDDKNMSILRQAKKKYGFKYVTVCYDLIPVFFPHFLVPGYREKLTYHFVNMVWNADLVMCISKYSQMQMQTFAEESCLKKINLDYFYLGSELPAIVPNTGSVKEPGYCIFVSTIEPRKNHDLLYKVWEMLAQKHGREKVPQLIFIGKCGWMMDSLLLQIKNNPYTQGKIIVQEHVSDSSLANLYQGALFTLFPSYVEGWGLPIAESLYYGKVCLHSDTSSMPEVSQGLSVSQSPYDVLSWFDAAEDLIFNVSHRRELESKIKTEYKPVSWRQSAETFYKRLENL